MGPDTSDIIPKGEIPTESEFARLMCDKTFVDYLNVFLSLPVFSQRLLYRFSDQSFELDPPLKRTQYRLDRVKLMRWVRTKRAPFFFKSDLYLEYLLCKHLQKTQLHLVINYGADSIGARDKMMDHCLMTRWLRQMSGMRRFRCFIAKTAGNNLVQFWLDAEKFRRKAVDDDADKWAIMYQRMEAKFFKNRNLKLPDFEKMKRLRNQCNAESPIASEGNAGTGIRSTRGMSGFEAFIVVQGFILKTLQNYWLPRYLVHCKQVFTKFNQTTLTIYRPDCYSVKVRSLSEIVNGDADAANDDGKERRESDVRSHHTIRKAQLKRQSVSNLMSMFSSSKVRRSELTTLLKVEDTGETVSAGLAEDDQIRQSTAEEDDELKVKGQDWLSEEFPLPAISEESASYRGSRSVSPAKSVVPGATSAASSQATSPEMPSCGDNEGEHYVRLGFLLTAEVIHQLPANSGDELLVHAQNLSCEALREVWDVFKRQDLDSFLNRTSQRKNSQPRAFPLYTSPVSNQASGHTLAPTPPDAPASPLGPKMERSLSSVLIEARKGGASPSDTDSGGRMPIAAEQDGAMSQSAAPYRLLRAVELGLCASGLGCADAVLSDLSDPEDESDDEGSLRRKHMVILRKRKIKTTPKPVIDRRRPQDIPRTTQHSRTKRSGHGSDTPQSNERDQETTKQGVCRAIRKGGKTIHRPSRPRTFVEVLHDSSHFEFFRRYLQVEVGNELPLSFWQSVEQLRVGNVRDPKVRQAKAAAIVKKYFNKSTNYGADLMTDADIIQDIPHMEKVTPQMLMSAQTCVAKSMEDKFFEDYRESYADDTTEDTINEEPAQKHFGQGRTKYLWNIFITNVCQFRRGLMTPWLLSLFKDFLGREIQREVEKQRTTGIVSKRIIGGKVVMVDKLQNDLCFWAEVERFKQLADNAARAAAAGTYTLEDEEYVQKKANAIIDVFLDSFVPPRVQINIPQEIAEDIIDIAQHGIIERGLFHDAAIHTFTVLLYCWKKFTRERLSYKSVVVSEEAITTEAPTRPADYLAPGEFGPPRISQPPKKKPMKKRRASTPRVCGVKIKTIIGASSDDAPRMFYTIETGVQLILPPKPKPDIEVKDRDRDRDRYRNIVRSLINSGHEESLLQLFQTQPAALGLGLAQQRRLSRSLGLPLPSQPTF
ncbi:uncharacterized protein [Diadema setosum]|uniref:uncharacterized protein n=1 Tax=Diadema setosum TaxID=31175 RepID=UPI003B3A57DD